MIVDNDFTVRGEPTVCTLEDAFRCFMATEIDMLAIGNRFLRKEKNFALTENYEGAFEAN